MDSKTFSLFGESSDDEPIYDKGNSILSNSNSTDKFENIFFDDQSRIPRGLILLLQAISRPTIDYIISQIPAGPNQHLYFTHLPPYLNILTAIASPYLDRIPIFDQAVVNKYCADDYLKFHVDLDRFQDGILICNLVGHVNFVFKRVCLTHNEGDDDLSYSISLSDGDCLILTGESRYEWSHGFGHLEGDRISITMRRLKLTGEGLSKG